VKLGLEGVEVTGVEVTGVEVTGVEVVGVDRLEVVVWADAVHPAKLSRLKPHRAAMASEYKFLN
jgi:hypothetical protein